MSCLDEDTLFALTQRQLPSAELERVVAHLDECARCLRLVADAMRAEEAPIPPPDTGDEPRATLEPGTLVDRYVVIEQVGAGAMGEVFLARDPELDRMVALKLLRADALDGAGSIEERRARMWREAKALARVSHPNLVSIYDVVLRGDQLFIAMEYVPGGTARQWLLDERRSPREVLDVFVKAGRGLAAAHEAGLVHRDFKPDNVLVSSDGKVRVSDFGLVVAVEETAALSTGTPATALVRALTESGVILGTPAYMAPDQLAGAPATPSSDQFSFCVTLYEALYGERPFAGKTYGALIREAREGRIRPAREGSRVPAAVRKVLLRGLSPSPEERFPSMHALLDALERAGRRNVRRTIAIAIAAPVLIAAAATIARGPPAPRCPPPFPLLETAWNAEHRDAVHEALLASGAADAGAKAETLEQAIKGYLRAWGDMYGDNCDATWRRRVQPERVFFLRMACLQDRIEEVRREVRAISAGGSGAIDRAAQVTQAFSPIESCAAARFR